MKANRLTFDAGVLSLYYAGDKRIKPYFDSVSSKSKLGFVSEVNLAEFYYKAAERFGLETAEIRYMMTRASQIILAPDEMITRDAARFKLKYGHKLSLADCFAISTAINNDCTLITTDSRIKQVKDVTTVYLSV
ncbi:MAG: PIN domain-containing protein [Nitrososphaerales archaeon]